MKNKTLLMSFKNAGNGFKHTFLSERNMKIHTLMAVLAIAAGIVLGIDAARWAVLIVTIGIVFICELFNTAVEKLTDMVTCEYSETAGKVKDISASAVLVSALISVIAGIFIFLDPVLILINKL